MLVRRLAVLSSSCVIASAAFAAAALGAHESNNRFDFKPTAAASGADGSGVSNYIAGASTPDNELWNSSVRTSGLAPNTLYTFWAENNNDTFEPTIDKAVCSFTTDAGGRGGCQRQQHNEPALAIARIRLGGMETFGAAVLEARRMPADADNKVDDGDIESSGGQRDK
ncbi:MAG: hypothetical protein WKF94_14005 [Solirubrobacteraceae bacterium]